MPLACLAAAAAARLAGQDPTPLGEQLRAALAQTSPPETEPARLEQFLTRNADRPLAEFAYARGLHLHARGQRERAAVALDAYFAEHAEVPITEHRARVGRAYRDALATLAGAPPNPEQPSRTPPLDLARLERWATRALQIDPDATAVLRAARAALASAEPPGDAARVRMALVRALLDTPRSDSDRDRALAALFGSAPRAAAGAPLDWRGTSLSSKRVDLLELRGRVVLLFGWTPWDPRCAADAPQVADAYLRYHTAGLEVIGIVPDPASEASDLLAQARAWDFPFEQVRVDAQNSLFEQLGVADAPFAVLLDQRGVPVAQGAQARGAELAAMIARLLGQRGTVHR